MHDCKYEQNIIEMSENIASIRQAIIGNGTKGLNDRVSDLEKDNQKHNIFFAGVFAVGGVCGYLIDLAIKVFK